MILLPKYAAMTVVEELDFSKGSLKRLYERWVDHMLHRDELSPAVRAEREKSLWQSMRKAGVTEIDLQFWFANHKPRIRR